MDETPGPSPEEFTFWNPGWPTLMQTGSGQALENREQLAADCETLSSLEGTAGTRPRPSLVFGNVGPELAQRPVFPEKTYTFKTLATNSNVSETRCWANSLRARCGLWLPGFQPEERAANPARGRFPGKKVLELRESWELSERNQ